MSRERNTRWERVSTRRQRKMRARENLRGLKNRKKWTIEIFGLFLFIELLKSNFF